MTALLEVKDLSRSFDGLKAVSELNFTVSSGDIFGIIGPNGAGKTTAVNLVSGVIKPTSGAVQLRRQGRDRQEPARAGCDRARAHVPGDDRVRHADGRGELPARRLSHALSGFLERVLRCRPHRRDGERLREAHRRGARLARPARVRDTVAGDLPYGAQKTLGMAISLMTAPKLLMLDEPVAGLSAAEADNVRDTIKKVRDRGISVVVIDHNMRFMAGLCDRILVMHHGQELGARRAAGRAARSEGDRGLSGAQLCQGLSCATSRCATEPSSAPTTSR